MELHKALQHIIQTEGQDIIKEIRLVNILDDFNAYQDIPASKYILRAIIAERYTNKLLLLGKWDNNAVMLSQKFSALTGFIPESVSVIFQSIAYGLGWINCIQFSQGKNYESTKYNKNNVSKEDHILNMIEIDASDKNGQNVRADNFSYKINSKKSFTLFCEFRKSTPQKDGTLRYALYDLGGSIIDEGYFGWVYDDEPSIVMRSKKFDFSYKDIGKIYLYWV